MKRAKEETRDVMEEATTSTSKERKHRQRRNSAQAPSEQNNKPIVQKIAQENMNHDHLVRQERVRAHQRTRKQELADGRAKLPRAQHGRKLIEARETLFRAARPE